MAMQQMVFTHERSTIIWHRDRNEHPEYNRQVLVLVQDDANSDPFIATDEWIPGAEAMCNVDCWNDHSDEHGRSYVLAWAYPELPCLAPR